MRAIWTGSISFGLVDVPVKLYSATESHDGEDRVILTKDDLEALPADDNDNIDVLQFVPNYQIDPIMLEKAYFLEPKSKTPMSYLLLR